MGSWIWMWSALALAAVPSSGEGDAALVVGAPDWAAWLATARGVPAEYVVRIEQEAPTAEAILQGAVQLSEQQGAGVLWIVLLHDGPAPVGLQALLDAVSVGATARPVVVVWDACTTDALALPEDSAVSLLAAPSAGCSERVPGLPGSALSYLLLGGLYGWADADGDGWVELPEAVNYAADGLDAVGVEHALRGVATPEGALAAATWEPPDPEQLAASLLAEPLEPVEAPIDPVTEMKRQIWWLRHDAEGRARAEAYAGTLHPGVGTGHIVLGETTFDDVGAGDVVDLQDPGCFVQGRLLPRRRGERIWPCRLLKSKHWSKATDLHTSAFSAHAVAVGEPLDHVESPPELQADRIREVAGRLTSLRTSEGIEVGMPITDALERMPANPDDVSQSSLQWFDLGLQLLIEGDWVRQIRIWPADGEPPPE
ncbi:MAG: hypothetical protein KTR31_26755 [Myxococcales bacterium]|nr:hypothetical protein [Myxococcales bacterium]